MKWYGSPGSYSISLETAAEIVRTNTDTSPDNLCSFEELKETGLISTREEYLNAVRNVAIYLAEKGIAESFAEKDTELLQLVRMLDELDDTINLLVERITEWYQSTNIDASRKYLRYDTRKFLLMLSSSKNIPMRQTAREIQSMTKLRSQLMKDVSAEADKVIPNMSALVGGLVAARLVSRAGSLDSIIKMAGSSIQVLGAESALFSHIRAGSPSPKHGLIFQHRRVHNAPKEIRGKVARVLAAKLAIAARMDAFRGELNQEFIDDANKKINQVMESGQ
ncbi:MAG TPA: RNA-processing protein [Methanocorpusculum sp.]|nr:RNA-processing protein [Methanocorpusculum sp.]HJJ40006.1 RNA-processing protein [Methanocorpusculum sp.]HJJ49489.1 RNA-processing protein [Methanocorpusculum sp.]HJJ57041.1 RNA-processing protein [Methanocorpusculum sp.]